MDEIETNEKFKAIIDRYRDPEISVYAQLAADPAGKLIQDKEGAPLVHHYFSGEMVKADDDESSITHYISTPRIDYVMDVMDPFGCNDVPLQKNKGVFYNHRWNGPRDIPVGRNLWLKKEKDGVLVKTQYAVGLTKDDFPGDVFRLAKGKFLNSYSVGFFPKSWDYLTIEDLLKLVGNSISITNVNEYQLTDKVWYYKSWVVYEYSQVGVPMNMDATQKGLIQKALSEGVVKSDIGKSILGQLVGREDLGAVPGSEKKPDQKADPEETVKGFKALEDKVQELTDSIAQLATALEGISGGLEQCISMLSELTEDDGGEEPADKKSKQDDKKNQNIPVVGTIGEKKSVPFDPKELVEKSVSGVVSRVKGKVV